MASVALVPKQSSAPLVHTREVKRRRAIARPNRNIGDNILLRSLYGVLTAILAIAGYSYFLAAAYLAFGGMGILVALLLSVSGGWCLVKYVLSV